MALGAALTLFVSACCCRPPLEERVRAAERENARLEFEVDATEKANAGARDYAKEIAAGGKGGPSYALYYAPHDLENFARRSLPYRIPAKTFNKQLQGTIIVNRLYDFTFLPGNRMTCKMDLRGQNIRFTGNVPGFAKQQVEDFIEGVEAGVVADLEIALTFRGQKVRALAVAKQTKLKKNSNASNEKRLTDEMNRRALKDAVDFDVRIHGYAASLESLVVTGNHLVIGYRP